MTDLTSEIVRARRHTIGDLLDRTAKLYPDKLAVAHNDVRQTYAQLDETVNRFANALAQRGVVKGDRIAILSHNSHAFVVAYYALAKLGAISVPVNFMLVGPEVAYILGQCEAKGILVEPALVQVAADALTEPAVDAAMTLRAGLGDCGPGWEDALAWMDHPDAAAPDVEISDDDCLQLLYTSGTESRPKGAMMASRNLIAQYLSCTVDGEMAHEDIEIHALPLFHTAALHACLSTDIYVGATSIILDGPDPAAMLAAVERESATKLFSPPTVWISLLRHPDFDTRDLSSLRKGYYGAASMPVEVLQELARRLPDVRLFNCYGQTEMSPLATCLGPDDQMRKAGSAGRPCINVETILVDDDDNPVPVGTAGEIVHRGPHVMLGYWNDPERTAEAFRNGWFHSGDLGVFDDEGYLTIVDRKKDMINTGGENVASREVEEMIYEHPAVAEVAVFALSHPKWIEAVTAAIVAKPGESLTAQEITEFCRERMAPYKVPKYVVIEDQLPKNPSGKLLKRDMRLTYQSLVDDES